VGGAPPQCARGHGKQQQQPSATAMASSTSSQAQAKGADGACGVVAGLGRVGTSRHLFLLPLLFLLLDMIHQFDCRQRPLSLPHRRHPEPQAGEEEALKREGRSAG